MARALIDKDTSGSAAALARVALWKARNSLALAMQLPTN
jgi:hypothetical protein